MWFGLPERNTLRPWESGSCIAQVLAFFFVALSCLKESKRTCLVLASVQVFYSLRPDSYNETQGPTGGPGECKSHIQ
jgi:hypothetical protein